MQHNGKVGTYLEDEHDGGIDVENNKRSLDTSRGGGGEEKNKKRQNGW